MAKVFQADIIAMDSDESLPPYCWAAFVLHGWWMYQPPSMIEKEHPWMMRELFFLISVSFRRVSAALQSLSGLFLAFSVLGALYKCPAYSFVM
jgi:hypothetical protein